MAGHGAEDIQKHVKTYLFVFAALAVLTIVTVAVSWLHIPTVWVAVAVAMLIAAVKATLVACYFMHLLSERNALFSILILCVIFFIVLMLLPVVTSTETASLQSHVT
jgi:caa(3)-type oxidase subunit IV